jgi:hypothetical protein
MPGTEENPNGSIVTLQPGWVELTPELAKNPILAHLMPQSDGEAARMDKAYQAQVDRDKAVADADEALATQREEAQREQLEDMQKASEEYAAEKEKVEATGQMYTEPHPDPEQQHALAITQPSGPVVTAQTMARKEGADTQGGPVPSGSSRARLGDTAPPATPGETEQPQE